MDSKYEANIVVKDPENEEAVAQATKIGGNAFKDLTDFVSHAFPFLSLCLSQTNLLFFFITLDLNSKTTSLFMFINSCSLRLCICYPSSFLLSFSFFFWFWGLPVNVVIVYLIKSLHSARYPLLQSSLSQSATKLNNIKQDSRKYSRPLLHYGLS